MSKSPQGRMSWLDAKTESLLIDDYTTNLGTFIAAMADGTIEGSELADQEKRLIAIMKEVEPALSDDMHAKVTQLLCELTAFNVMQTLHSLQDARLASNLSTLKL